MTTIKSFHDRLAKIGIEVTFIGNYPWVYLNTVCGKKVRGKFQANHGFTVFFRAIRTGQSDTITDITEIFKKIRETLKQAKENPSDYGTGEIWVDKDSIINAPNIILE